MNAKAEVVGIGSCTVDYFAIVPRLLGPEEKINATRMEIHAGGVTANNLTQVARLGASTGWLGLIGDDENGRIIQKAFTEDGMDLSGIEVVKGEHSSLTWIPVDSGGERCIYMFPNVTGKITVHQVLARFAQHIQAAKHFHTEASQLPIAPVKQAMQVAHDANVRVIFDLDVAPSFFAAANLGTQDELCTALRLADVLKPCKAAARELTGEADYEKIARQLLGLGPKDRGAHAGRGRLHHRRVRQDHARPGAESGCGGYHRRGRRVYGRPFLRPIAGLGKRARGIVCQCLRGFVLHESGGARDGQTRRGDGADQGAKAAGLRHILT